MTTRSATSAPTTSLEVREPNALGFYDVHGNVWEWCLDGYDRGFYGQVATKDPVYAPEGSSHRVNRGGSYLFAAVFARSAFRSDVSPEIADDSLPVCLS